MFQPNNIFAFEKDLTLYVFISLGEFSSTEFIDFIDTQSANSIPDNVLLYYTQNQINAEDLKLINAHIESRFHSTPKHFQFNNQGQFSTESSEVKLFLKTGIEKLVNQRSPILQPPPGKSFSKPSGAKSAFFLQASNLFVRHAEMAFFALLLIREWGALFDESIKTIYVDTIDLYGLTSLACRMKFIDAATAPITVSFSSYSSYKTVLKKADVSSSLMVVSATTSHNLLKKILKKTRWKEQNRIVTIIGLKSTTIDKTQLPPKVITQLSPPNSVPHVDLLPSIRLSGENFSLEVDEPKSVVLNAFSHTKCFDHIDLSLLDPLDDCFGGYSKWQSQRTPICIDAVRLLNSNEFCEWLRSKIEMYAPASTTHVVCIEGHKKINEVIDSSSLNGITYLSPDQIQEHDLSITGSVLVICPTFTTGTKLLEVSRDLRKHGVKNLIYFTGIGTPDSLTQYKKLKGNLEHGVYKLCSFMNLCIGAPESLNLSWKIEQEILRELTEYFSNEELSDRSTSLENGKLTHSNIFYRVEDLDFHEGFLYWQNRLKYEPQQKQSILIFLTYAIILQDARTNKSLCDKDSLAPLPNRRVLLDPENFFRFNDPLIQIAILRAAYPGELDYSDHAEHSSSMFYILERSEQIKNRGLVYEILLAIASKRLRLTSDINSRIVKLLDSSSMDECKWFLACDFFDSLGSKKTKAPAVSTQTDKSSLTSNSVS